MASIEKEPENLKKRDRYPNGADFFELFRWHMKTGTRPEGHTDHWGIPWDAPSLAEAIAPSRRSTRQDYVGVTSASVMNWTKSTRPNDCASIADAFFGSNPEYGQWRDDFFFAHSRLPRRGGAPRKESGPKPPSLDLASYNLPPLNLYQLDRLPVNERIAIESVAYGYGDHAVHEPAERLVWLPAATSLIVDRGDFGGTARFCPPSRPACEALAREHALFWPRQFRVIGRRPTVQWALQLYVVTDIAYPSGTAYPGYNDFELPGFLGIEGPGAFFDADGRPWPRTSFGIGEGLGCTAVVAVVGFLSGHPVQRSCYFIMVRKGHLRLDDE
jgi:hypothetical protein